MNEVRIGIIGLGNMGSAHARLIQEIPGLRLTACCDVQPQRAGKVVARFGGTPFTDYRALLKSAGCDAVLIATPHFDHTSIGIAALKAGLHVLVEKPISVHKSDAERLIRAHRNPEQIFAAMFNQRTNPAYQYIRQALQDGSFGQVRRFQWTITDWFRSQSYYDSGGWRATWAGEGGGVLLNQCPHQLDLMQWLFGMPSSVRAFCRFGKHHDVEVEDEVTAYLDYDDGKTGMFITTTGEAPGSNRLEIATDGGRLVYDTEENLVSIRRNDKSVSQAILENSSFEKPETVDETVPLTGAGGQHAEILSNFSAAILEGEPLIAPAGDGIHSVELANAMLLSSWLDKTVALPISSRQYATRLKKKMTASAVKTNVSEAVADDMSSSF